MKVKINFEKKHLAILLLAIGLVVSIGYAIAGIDATKGWHGAGQINVDIDADGTPDKSLQEAIDNNDFGGGFWTETPGGIKYTEGKVGIGIPSPGGKLEVNTGGIWNSGDFPFKFVNLDGDTTESYGMLIRAGGNNAGSKILEVRDHDGNPDFIVKGDGKVGIGTNAPQAPLEIRMPGNYGVRIGTGGNVIDGVANDGSYGNLWLNYNSEGNVLITKLSGSGKVGIGTDSPQAKLDVAGDARITGKFGVDSGLPGNFNTDDWAGGDDRGWLIVGAPAYESCNSVCQRHGLICGIGGGGSWALRIYGTGSSGLTLGWVSCGSTAVPDKRICWCQ